MLYDHIGPESPPHDPFIIVLAVALLILGVCIPNSALC